MSSNKTTNYQLHSWEPGDDFLRTEFNENFGAIDGAIPRIITGYYMGDGQSSREIEVGFQPKATYLCMSNGNTVAGSYTYGGVALPESHSTGINLTGNGFRVEQNGNTRTNYSGTGFFYFVIG